MIPLWRGFSIVEFVTAAALATAVGFAVLPGYVRSSERAGISRAAWEINRTARALGGYYIDHRTCPPSGRASSGEGALTANSFAPAGSGSRHRTTFRVPDPSRQETFATLTTPVPYLDTFPVDPFAHTQGTSLGYHAEADSSGWILFSFGPDRDENGWAGPGDIEPMLDTFLESATREGLTWRASAAQADVTYDPSNGTFSNGDLWRVEDMNRAVRGSSIGSFSGNRGPAFR